MIQKYSKLHLGGATTQQLNAVATQLGMDPQDVRIEANRADPSPENKFEAWVVKQMGLRVISLPQDAESVKKLLKSFTDLINKRQLKEKDINKYSWESLQETIDTALNAEISGQNSPDLRKYLKLPGVFILGQNSKWLVLASSDPDSSSKLAVGTKWCTSDPEVCASPEYEPFLIILFQKTGSHLKKMYQIAPDGSDFKDIHDDDVDSVDSSALKLVLTGVESYRDKVRDDDVAVSEIDLKFGSFLALLLRHGLEVDAQVLLSIEAAAANAPSEIYEFIEQSGRHEFRDTYLELGAISGHTPEEILELIRDYFNIVRDLAEKIPRWVKFETWVKDTFDPEDTEEFSANIIQKYLKLVDSKERILALEPFFFTPDTPEESIIFSVGDYIQDKKFPTRWKQFEAFCERIATENMRGKDIPSNRLNSWVVAKCIAQYWLRAQNGSPEHRWEDVEPFLEEFGDSSDSSGYNPYDSYWWAVGK